jgi:diguanylate cyclase (GGDEF)-like protein
VRQWNLLKLNTAQLHDNSQQLKEVARVWKNKLGFYGMALRAHSFSSSNLSKLFSVQKTYAEQVSTIQRIAPMVLCINILVIVSVAALFWSTSLHVFALIWSSIGIGLSGIGLINWHRTKKIELTRTSIHKAVQAISLFAGLRAAHWAAGFIVFMPVANSASQIALGWTIAGMLCGGNFAYSTLPRAALTYLVIMAAGGVMSFLALGTSVFVFLIVALTLFTGFLIVTTLSNTQMLRSHVENQNKLADQNEFMGIILRDFEDGASDWLWEIGSNHKITRGAERFQQCLGTQKSVTSAISLIDILQSQATNEGQRDSVVRLLASLGSSQAFSEIVVHLGKDENERYLKFSAKQVEGSEGSWRGVVSDITAIMISQNRVNFLAFHDSLTGLPNRLFIKDCLDRALRENKISPHERTVMSIDLDGFKAVNDTYGHQVGDRLLVAVAKRMQSVLAPTDVLSRMGGDEFLLICNTSGQDSDIEDYASRLLRAVSEPFGVLGHRLIIGASIGIARVGHDGDTATDILRHVDLALYRAKSEGKGVACQFNLSMDLEMQKKRALENDLRAAVANSEFVLHYQPIVSVSDSKVCGYEALIRWQHPERGLIPPLEFIPVAEETGLIVQIGEWVINEACKQAITWPSNIRVSVNLSPLQIKSPRLVAAVVKSLADSGLRPGRLEMEVTESALLEQTELVFTTLGHLKTLGVRIGLDDFGTGYSSLGYLHTFAFDNIKIDRSFIQAMATRPQSAAVVRAVLMLAEDLGISTTAEGIETIEQFNALKLRGCQEAQGYYFGRPMPIMKAENSASAARKII